VTPEARLKLRVGRRGGREVVDLRRFRPGEGIGVFDQATKCGFALPRKSLPALVEPLRMAGGTMRCARARRGTSRAAPAAACVRSW
jgi:hypothetical protein